VKGFFIYLLIVGTATWLTIALIVQALMLVTQAK
jgi:hypothetical protein